MFISDITYLHERGKPLFSHSLHLPQVLHLQKVDKLQMTWTQTSGCRCWWLDSADLHEAAVDLPPAQDELGLLVPDLLQLLQLFEGALVEDVQDLLPRALQDRRVQLRLPARLRHVLFTVWWLRGQTAAMGPLAVWNGIELQLIRSTVRLGLSAQSPNHTMSHF